MSVTHQSSTQNDELPVSLLIDQDNFEKYLSNIMELEPETVKKVLTCAQQTIPVNNIHTLFSFFMNLYGIPEIAQKSPRDILGIFYCLKASMNL